MLQKLLWPVNQSLLKDELYIKNITLVSKSCYYTFIQVQVLIFLRLNKQFYVGYSAQHMDFFLYL